MWGQSLTDQIGVEVRGRSDVPILHLQHHVVRYFLLDYVYEECSELLLVLLQVPRRHDPFVRSSTRFSWAYLGRPSTSISRTDRTATGNPNGSFLAYSYMA